METLWWYLLVGGNILIWTKIVIAGAGLVVAAFAFVIAAKR